MTQTTDSQLDLTVSRIIKAPRARVWAAWTTPSQLEQWWVPAPARSRVVELDLTPGGSFLTEISEGGGEFGPHIAGCFLAVDPLERIVFTNALVSGWRPAENPFITASITFAEHPEGTEYTALVKHKDTADAAQHRDLGFYDGWGTVTEQLAALTEATHSG
ncbi:SRPBCC family protein [Rhodococcus sp. P1Y]|uniref:SRPBCC family protein n=1 Tax=Rhodococcus sp. P1Y TaxID=1302308 RepID=UPI000EAFA26C|nr:SRPBCC family protein [Rhodococcus sp. P1Y]AYJ50450.1 polyketide cyclase [Rhodococcus sp. P1Y]